MQCTWVLCMYIYYLKHTCNCGRMYKLMCVYMCAHVHVRVCDDNYMNKKEWVAGPNTNWMTFHKPRLIAKMLPSFLDMYRWCSYK